MKHTQGKWNLFLQDDNGFGITNGDSVIAIAGEGDLPENEANANLIASAPEMLEMLKRVVDGKKSIPRKDVRKLIAKAERSHK